MNKQAKDILAQCAKVAFAAERAAMKSGKDREFSALRDIIERQEKEHRSFGRRLVGSVATKGRMPVRASVDYFVTKVLASGYGKNGFAWERQLSALDGLRGDYVQGAILMANKSFRTELGRALAEEGFDWRELIALADKADYSALVGS